MKVRPSDLWRWDGNVDRGEYAFWGLFLAAAKWNLDRLIMAGHGAPWHASIYWIPGGAAEALLHDSSASAIRWTMFATALPFLWAGVVLTLRRLRSAGLPPWLVAFFFVPAANVLFFIVLSFVPPRAGGRRGPPERLLARLIPRSHWGSAAMAMAATVVPTGLTAVLATEVTRTYGWTMFVSIPFMMGFYSAMLYTYHEPRSLGQCVSVMFGSLALLGVLLVAVAFEGIICVLMAFPIAGAIGFAGTLLGHFVSRVHRHQASSSLLALLLALPLLVGAEAATEPAPPLQAVRTSVEIDAPPERVWRYVVSFTEIPPPGELIFRTGISYPLRAEIRGHGVGAVRHCVFTTGAFIEPITTWDEARLLAFGVSSQPAPMEEWTPYPGIHPPHLDGYFVSQRGQFLLEALPGGRTRLEGTTWYTHRLWPTIYWGLWSDAVIHQIHGRVLRHVKRLAEGGET